MIDAGVVSEDESVVAFEAQNLRAALSAVRNGAVGVEADALLECEVLGAGPADNGDIVAVDTDQGALGVVGCVVGCVVGGGVGVVIVHVTTQHCVEGGHLHVLDGSLL